MWQIFEDNGANEYATWVWEIYCPIGANHDYPERYYPGDKYVDWIGLSAFARTQFPTTDVPFGSLVYPTYAQMRTNHREKPVLMSEFGKTKESDQVDWIRDAFRDIKSCHGMKAAIFWDNTHKGDDHTLSIESLKLYKEIMKDPYFIGASITKS